jgi:hypothetical protein
VEIICLYEGLNVGSKNLFKAFNDLESDLSADEVGVDEVWKVLQAAAGRANAIVLFHQRHFIKDIARILPGVF